MGTYGSVLDEALLTSKMAQYPDEVGGKEDFIRQNWLGGRTADCVGLIKGYGWYNTQTAQIEIGANGMLDIGWEAMSFKYTEGEKQCDPGAHSYIGGENGDWSDKSRLLI